MVTGGHVALRFAVLRLSRWFSTAGGRELEARSTPSCSFNFMADRPTGSRPANQTPRNNGTRKHTRSHGQVWLGTGFAEPAELELVVLVELFPEFANITITMTTPARTAKIIPAFDLVGAFAICLAGSSGFRCSACASGCCSPRRWRLPSANCAARYFMYSARALASSPPISA